MHNLHLIVYKADTPEDACNEVENIIEDFGNENNWSSIGGCISTTGKTYTHDTHSRWTPKREGYNTIAKLNEMVKEWIDDEAEADVFNTELHIFQYDECGVTNLEGEGRNTYVIFLDMHS